MILVACIVGIVIFGIMAIAGIQRLMMTVIVVILMVYTVIGLEHKTSKVLSRQDCAVTEKMYHGYNVKCIEAFNELVPLLSMDQRALSGMEVNWHGGSTLNADTGDSVYVYLFEVKRPLLMSSKKSICIATEKDRFHEYELFQAALQQATKVGVVEP